MAEYGGLTSEDVMACILFASKSLESISFAPLRRVEMNAVSRGPAAALWLRNAGHTVFSVYDEAKGISDDEILQKALDEQWILITNDKDFGQMVYRHRRPHRGVIFLRLDDERAAIKIDVLSGLLASHTERLADQFVAASATTVGIARP